MKIFHDTVVTELTSCNRDRVVHKAYNINIQPFIEKFTDSCHEVY